MRKKILLAAVIVIFLASVCAIWFIKNDSTNSSDPGAETTKNNSGSETEIYWNMNGAFISVGGYEDAITVIIDGKIIENENGGRSLHGNIDLPEGFRYILGDTDGALAYIQNQENDYFPDLMIFASFIYNTHKKAATPLTLALDMEKGHAIALMGDAPNCYLVASRDPNVDSQQLMEHFKEFIDKEATRAWGFHNRFYFTNCRITPTLNETSYGNALYIPDYYRDLLVSKIASTTIDKNGTDSANIDPYSVMKASTGYTVELITGETISLALIGVKNSYKTELTYYLAIEGQKYQCASDINDAFDELEAYVSSQTKAHSDLANLRIIEAAALPEGCLLRGIDLTFTQVINSNAFSDSQYIEQVRLGDRLQEVYTGAFRNCSKLKEVYFKVNPEVLQPGIFDSGVTLYAPPGGTVEAYAKAEGLAFQPLPEIIPPLSAFPADSSAFPSNRTLA